MTLETQDKTLEHFSREGFGELKGRLDAGAAEDLMRSVLATRSIDGSLFLTQKEWEASPKTHRHTNPGPGYNVLERFPGKLAFIEDNAELRTLLSHVLGPDYYIISKKLVCRLPWNIVPAWLREKIYGTPSNTMGAYIRPAFRDMIYFVDNDLHQDIQDRIRLPEPERNHRFITLYVYLGDVGESDAPVHLLPGSHRFGATRFQHDIRFDKDSNEWIYADERGRSMASKLHVFTGGAGDAALWHSCIVHGAPPVKDSHLRISARYIIGSNPGSGPHLLDTMNSSIDGPLYLDEDFTPGQLSNADGSWNLKPTDFISMGYAKWKNP